MQNHYPKNMTIIPILQGNAKKVVRVMYQESFENGLFLHERFFEKISEFSMVAELSDIVNSGKKPSQEEFLEAQIRAYKTTYQKHPEALPHPDFNAWLQAKKELLQVDPQFYSTVSQTYSQLHLWTKK